MIATDEALGARIRQLRSNANLTQVELAARLGMGQSTLSRLEDGSRSLSASDLIDISSALNLSVSELLADDSEHSVAQSSKRGCR